MRKNLKFTVILTTLFIITMIPMPSVKAEDDNGGYVAVEVGNSWTYSLLAYFDNVSISNITETDDVSVVITILSISDYIQVNGSNWGRNVTVSWNSTQALPDLGMDFTYQEFEIPVFEDRHVYEQLPSWFDGPVLIVNARALRIYDWYEDGNDMTLEYDYYGVMAHMNIVVNDNYGGPVHMLVNRNDVSSDKSFIGVSVGDTWTFEMQVDYDSSSMYSDETVELILTVSKLSETFGDHLFVVMEWAFTPDPVGLGMESGTHLESPVFQDTNMYNDYAAIVDNMDGPIIVINPAAPKSYSWNNENGDPMSITYDENGVVETMDFYVNAEDNTKVHLTVSKTGSFNIPGFTMIPFAIVSMLAIVALLRRRR